MSAHDIPRTLFVGLGKSGLAWYRCALPAMYLDCDWLGASGNPPDLRFVTGLAGDAMTEEDFLDYEVVVLQQPASAGWLKAIEKLRAAGVKVLFDIDDYVHDIRHQTDHANAKTFGLDRIRHYDLCMAACDGVIVSTPWLADRYRRINPRVWVCRNGLDLGRYDLTRPRRPGVAIGWSGAVGHTNALMPWLTEVATIMEQRPESRFVSVGEPFATPFIERFGATRAMAVGYTPLETYPAAMTMFDIALAPVGNTTFYRGKSDLRWLEAGALGIPVIGDPAGYPEIEHGVTGFHAASPAELREVLFELVDNADMRERVGAAAREHVREHRDMRVMSAQWADVLREVLAAPPAAASDDGVPTDEVTPAFQAVAREVSSDAPPAALVDEDDSSAAPATLEAIRLTDFELDAESGVHVPAGENRGFRYSDGAERYLLEALRSIEDRSVGSEQIRPLMKDWASNYHLTPYRSTILDAIGLSRLDRARVLELGAGCGAITRWLGETGAEVHAIEGSPHRAAVARARTADLDNVSLYSANYSGLDEHDAFDLVTLIGVLEYSHLYHPLYHEQPERAAVANLVTAAQALRENGVLVIAIENRMGLKYLNGAHEDHSGRFFEGIQGYPYPNSVVTFNERRLRAMCAEAGFDHVEVLVPYPDYKLARQVINPARVEDDDRVYNWMNSLAPGRGPQRRPPVYNESLAIREAVQAGLLTDLANSHLALAFVGDPQEACERLGLDLDWSARHYSLDRRAGLRKRITLADGVIKFEGLPLGEDEAEAAEARAAVGEFGLRFQPDDEPQRRGDLLMYSVLESVIAEGFGVRFEAHVREYRAWLVERFGVSHGTSLDMVSGDAFDATWWNLVVDPETGEWQLIDGEWRLDVPVPADYVLWRMLLWFFRGHVIQVPALRGQDVDHLVQCGLTAAGTFVPEEALVAFKRAEDAILAAIMPGPLPAEACDELLALSNLGEPARIFSVVAFADEVIENPSLLTAYAGQFAAVDRATLTLYAPDTDERHTGAAVEVAMRTAGFDDDGPDLILLAVAGGEGTERLVADGADAVYSEREGTGPLAGLLRVGADGAVELRRCAEAMWAST